MASTYLRTLESDWQATTGDKHRSIESYKRFTLNQDRLDHFHSGVLSVFGCSWRESDTLVNKPIVSEVLSEQFLKTKAIKPVTKEGQHNRVEIGVRRQATPGYRGVS